MQLGGHGIEALVLCERERRCAGCRRVVEHVAQGAALGSYDRLEGRRGAMVSRIASKGQQARGNVRLGLNGGSGHV